MNCHSAQRRLLSLADATRVPASLRSHLIDCPTCQEWHRRVVQVDRHIPLLAIPPANFAKARFLRELRTKPTVWRTMRNHIAELPGQARRLGRRQIAAAGLAAAVLLCLFAWNRNIPNQTSLADRSHRNEPDPLLAALVQRNMILAETDQPQQQAETLGQIADDLRGQAQTLARAANTRGSQEVLAKWYGDVVGQEVKRAAEVPLAERDRALVPLARQLARAAAETNAQVRDTPASHPLRNIVLAARKGKKELDALVGQHAAAEPLISLTLPPPTLAAAGFVFASAEPGLSAAEQALQFQRNEKLIQVVVKGSLLLAEETDPIRRANVCKQIARIFAEEIERAANEHEGGRAAELSGYFGTVLQRGVAANLKVAGEKIPLVSMQNEPLLNLGDEVNQLIQPLDRKLRRDADPETRSYLEQASNAVRTARQDVRDVLKDRRTQTEIQADPKKN